MSRFSLNKNIILDYNSLTVESPLTVDDSFTVTGGAVITGNLTVSGSVSGPNLYSGSSTCNAAVTNGTGVIAPTARVQWIVVGSIIYIGGNISITSLTSSSGNIRITLPWLTTFLATDWGVAAFRPVTGITSCNIVSLAVVGTNVIDLNWSVVGSPGAGTIAFNITTTR